MSRQINVRLMILPLFILPFISSITFASTPYDGPRHARESVYEFTQKPTMRYLGDDYYEITFTSKGACDVTVAIVDKKGQVVRHLASGVLGKNAPEPFQKNSLQQKLNWDGKDDLGTYVKEPQSLRLRVSLGLKPTFDKLLGGSHPKNLPGFPWGIAADANGVYVFVLGMGRGHITVRRFNHDTQYAGTVYPPPANLPEEKLAGMGYVEYEPGKRALHGPIVNRSLWREGFWLPYGLESGYGIFSCRPVCINGRLYFASSGSHPDNANKKVYKVLIHNIHTDGSTNWKGMKGRLWHVGARFSNYFQMASSPDGKQLYYTGFESDRTGHAGHPIVLAGDLQSDEQAKVLLGKKGTPGSDNKSLNKPLDIATDAQGQIYVVDHNNNRVQIISPDGSFLKTIEVDRPRLVQVHQKTGAIYVAHAARVKGKSIGAISKFSSFPTLKLEHKWENISADLMTLDSWSSKPRLWTGAGRFKLGLIGMTESFSGGSVVVYEEAGGKLNVFSDFHKEAQQASGKNFHGKWDGGIYHHVNCDPVREKVYLRNNQIFDLRSGSFTGHFAGRDPKTAKNTLDNPGMSIKGAGLWEIAFDKSGYLHAHLASGFELGKQGIARMDPDRILQPKSRSEGRPHYSEVPYNYGLARTARWDGEWTGVLPLYRTDHQLWSWGFGVNMRGDVAVNIHVEFAPKMESEAWMEANLARKKRKAAGMWVSGNVGTYESWMKSLKEQEKRGQRIFFIQRRPGIPLTGATVWTFDSSGELRNEAGVVAGMRNNGVQIDENRFLYFTNSRFKLVGDKPFLHQAGGNYGGDLIYKRNILPYTGTYMKTPEKDVLFIKKNAPVQMDPLPDRPADLATPTGGSGGAFHGPKTFVWVEKAEWMYAGASPIVAEHCDCPQMRVHLDWFKRSFVPEDYRHSIGVLDTNGNLITHIGQYGNFDSGYGPDSKISVGGDGIAFTKMRYISGTDNYLCFSDWGQRLIVLKLNYHQTEEVAIRTDEK